MKIHDPAMTFKDPASAQQWQEGLANNQDAYGNAIYRFASEWATRMEQKLTAGSTVSDCAKVTSHEGDNEGITGFMYGAAVSLLAAWWIYGEDLRRWHNLDTQIKDEGVKANESGTVLNPALLSINV